MSQPRQYLHQYQQPELSEQEETDDVVIQTALALMALKYGRTTHDNIYNNTTTPTNGHSTYNNSHKDNNTAATKHKTNNTYDTTAATREQHNSENNNNDAIIHHDKRRLVNVGNKTSGPETECVLSQNDDLSSAPISRPVSEADMNDPFLLNTEGEPTSGSAYSPEVWLRESVNAEPTPWLQPEAPRASHTVLWEDHTDGRGCRMALLSSRRRVKLISKYYTGVRKPSGPAMAPDTSFPTVRLKRTRKMPKAHWGQCVAPLKLGNKRDVKL